MSGRMPVMPTSGRKTSTKAGSACVEAMMANRNSTEPGETSEPLASPRKANFQSVINAVRFQASLASGAAGPSSSGSPAKPPPVGIPSSSELSAEERKFLEERAALNRQPARQRLPASPVKVLSPRSERLYGPGAAQARRPAVPAPSAGRAAAEPARDLSPGARVRIQKFDIKDLNGKTGTVRRYDEDRGGYIVELDKDGGVMCFLMKYLVIIEEPGSPSGSRPLLQPSAGPDLSSHEARQALPSKAARMLGIKQNFDEEAEKREEERIRQLILEEEGQARAGIVKLHDVNLHEDSSGLAASGAAGDGDADDGGSEASSSEADEEEVAAAAAAAAQTKAKMAGLGFKLNLGSVKANEVDDEKPEAIPHTPKGDIVERLQAERAAVEAARLEAGGRYGSTASVASTASPEQVSEQVSARLSVAEQLSAGEVPTKEAVERMGVAQLRELVAAAGLSTADCVEKADLRSRAREAVDCLAYTLQQRLSSHEKQRNSKPEQQPRPAAAAAAPTEPQKRKVQLQEPAPAPAPAAQQQRGGGGGGASGEQQEEILKEGWMLKEAGNNGKRGGLGLVGGAFKSALPHRRYFVLFPSRLDYFVHVNVLLKSGTGPGSARLGVTLNDWNMVTTVDAGGAADGLLHEGDVLVSVDEMSVAGLFVAEVMDSKKPKHLVGCIRRKGSVPLSAGVTVAPCKAALSKITSLASAFEIDLRAGAVRGDKDRYVLICASPDEADQWRDAIGQQCKGDGTRSSSDETAPRLPPHVLKQASDGAMEQTGAGFGEDSSGSMASINSRSAAR